MRPSSSMASPLQRLTMLRIPETYLKDLQPGLVRYVKNNKSLLPDIVSAIIPTDEAVIQVPREGRLASRRGQARRESRDLYRESMVWLKWLMFEGDPETALVDLANLSSGERGVCGAVWGKNDLAFRCRTCELDPTCAICAPCFQNGDHSDHDYSIIYTGGGCCDCGDETAWKREGFCSKHKGSDQIKPLPDAIASSVGAVLDALFSCWRSKLLAAETTSGDDASDSGHGIESKVSNDLSYVVVEMLLDFCGHSESLLSFVSKRLVTTADLLSLLVRAERFLSENVTKELHELLLKLLAEPVFKYEFSKVFVDYYHLPVAEVIKARNDTVMKKYPLQSTFAVQIFTVPTLTPRLVKEWNLLGMLLGCLGEILLFCLAEDDKFQFNNWASVFNTFIRVVEDIKFVLSHSDVAKYVTHERPDIVKAWLQLLSVLQGISPQKRETGIHVEEEFENAHLPFIMCNSIAIIHSLLVKGAFSVPLSDEMDEKESVENEREGGDDGFNHRHAKVGRVSEESSASSSAAHSIISDTVHHQFDAENHFMVLPSVLNLTFDSSRAIDYWLAGSNIGNHVISGDLRSKLSTLKEAVLTVKKENYVSRPFDGSLEMSEHYPTANGVEQDTIMETEILVEKVVLPLLSLSEWPNIDYDVSSQEISVHMPLHALLSLILKEALRKYCSESLVKDNGDIISQNSLSHPHDFFQNILKGCHPIGFSSFVMEHPLQTRVFCSQYRAGMWRRNGDAAVLCFDWYRSVRWSDHQLEIDLFLLQFCAAFAPADLYVKRLLERFQLSNYLDLDVKRSSEYEPVLMQELLTLIIQIAKERRFCALTASENLQRELICKLATGDATHSQLVKSLPRDLSKLEQLQDVLDRIAQYSNPSGMDQGKYSLQLPYWKELDLYYPCWNPRDLQVAEERYARFCGVSALSAQLPKWTKIYKPLIGLARIATCRTVLQIIRAVVFYAVSTDKSTESRAPDGVLITALHLLALALDICSSERKSGHTPAHNEDHNSLLVVATEEIGVEIPNETGRQSLLSLLVFLLRMHKKEDSFMEAANFSLSCLVENLLKKFAEIDSECLLKLQQCAPEIVSFQVTGTATLSSTSDTEKRKIKARERQAAMLAKMKAEQSKFLASVTSTADTGSGDSSAGKKERSSGAVQDSEEANVCCLCHDTSSKDPVSFLILLQKSRLVNFVNRGPPSWDRAQESDEAESSQSESERTNPQARNTDAVALEKLPSSELAQIVEGAVTEFASQAHPEELNAFVDYIKLQFPQLRRLNVPGKKSDKKVNMAYSLESVEQDVFLTVHKDLTSITDETDVMVEGISSAGNTAISCNQDSLLLGKYIASLTKEPKDPSAISTLYKVESAGQFASYDGFGPSDCDGIHVSSCGHAVHQGCLDSYLSSLKERYNRRMVFEGGHIVDPDQGEFLCPLCRRLANSSLPAVPGDSCRLLEMPMVSQVPSRDSSGSVTAAVDESGSLRLQYALSMLRRTASFVSKGETLKALPLQRNRRTEPNLEPVFHALNGMYFPGKQDAFSRSGRGSPSVLMWDTLKYSLVSTEIAARCGKSSLAARKGLGSLYSEFSLSGGFILPLLLRIAHCVRTTNLPDLLLRFRGLQLLEASICSGVTYGKCYEGTSGKEGNIFSILEYSNSETMFPDTKFWNQASDPVLTRDPFSTLMWILYCLPFPFLSSKEFLLSLVHIFYGISVSQAIITYCSFTRCNMNEAGFQDCLVSDIANLVGESVITKQCFLSRYIDPSSPIKDVIDCLSLPYLRRCSLMLRLLGSSVVSPFPSMSDELDKSLNDCFGQEASSSATDEVHELRNMFGIPSLDIIVKDGVLRSLVLKWFGHLVKESEDRGIQRDLCLTPSIPFQLMRLPLIYQDLVQRYIKIQCPNCKAVQDEPALCLLCGRLCSPSWKPCCRESGCQAHALSCGAGTGVFLLIRRTTILLQRNARQATWPSPYLDAFGEEDADMKRGKPLFLKEERYAALTYMVASHGLDRSTKVLRESRVALFLV